MRSKLWVFLSAGLASGIFSSVINAENLLDVYQQSLKNDMSLLAAKSEYQASLEVIPQAKAGLLPEVTLEAERVEARQDIISSDNLIFSTGKTSFPTKNYTLSITQPVFRYDAWLQHKQSKAIVRQAHAEYAAAQQALIVDVADAYFSVLAAQDSLNFAHAEKKAVGKQREVAEERVKTGMARVTDLHDARARYALTESQEIEAENILDDSNQALSERTGEQVGVLMVLQDDIPLVSPDPTDLDQWVKTALEQNIELEVLRHRADVAAQQVEMQKAGHYPDVDLVATYNKRDTEGTLFGGGSEVDTTNYLLRLKVPLYQGGGVQSKIREARHKHAKALQELEAQRRQVRRNTRAAYLGVLSGIKKVEALKQSIISQQSALEVKSAGLKAGVNTLLAVLDAQRDLYSARRDYAQARYDYLLSTLRIKQATGSLSDVDLQWVNALVK